MGTVSQELEKAGGSGELKKRVGFTVDIGFWRVNSGFAPGMV
jgi:hypothetical protein